LLAEGTPATGRPVHCDIRNEGAQSSIYQCVEADTATQHVRRILWRFGDTDVGLIIFVTTKVNYGDRPAGCIARAAVRETAERFGKEREEAHGS
jgi:hypothetical protein